MTILHGDEIKSLFNLDVSVRKAAMTTTLFTSKFLSLLNIAEKSLQPSDKRWAADTRRCCMRFKNTCLEGASKLDGSIPFYNAAWVYSQLDGLVVSASIQEKIQLWAFACSLAIESNGGLGGMENMEGFLEDMDSWECAELTPAQIADEMLDYIEEISAWLDDYFYDEYDEYSDNEEFDGLIEINAGLEGMAKIFQEMTVGVPSS